MVVYSAGDHLVKFEVGVAFFAVAFEHDVATLVVAAPVVDEGVEVLVGGCVGQGVDHGAGEAAEVEAGVGVEDGFG